ncbi:30S ribosomal protein S19 [Candidatus Woesearchaeota archaeon]|nr:30S ribosomal protein S19 [Candidatus Woesearchaeota archaeon]
MAKATKWYGKSEEELKSMDFKEFLKLIPSRSRRSLQRSFNNDSQKKLLKKIDADSKNIRTQRREMVVIPSMIGKTIKIYSGREWVPVTITVEMLGHYLGEFALTRKGVTHGSAGLGATRSSRAVSAK